MATLEIDRLSDTIRWSKNDQKCREPVFISQYPPPRIVIDEGGGPTSFPFYSAASREECLEWLTQQTDRIATEAKESQANWMLVSAEDRIKRMAARPDLLKCFALKIDTCSKPASILFKASTGITTNYKSTWVLLNGAMDDAKELAYFKLSNWLTRQTRALKQP